MASNKFSFKGWSLIEFIKGRKKLLVALVGGFAGYMATQSPQVAALTAITADFLYALIDYYTQE